MIRKQLTQWLTQVYELPVVEFFDETRVENQISYDLTSSPIDVRQEEGKIKFSFTVSVSFRCPNGFAGIGFLSLGLANIKKQVTGFNLSDSSSAESIDYETKTEMVISKDVTGFIYVEHNQVRELIKCIRIEGNLPCEDDCPAT